MSVKPGKWLEVTIEHVKPGDVMWHFGEVRSVKCVARPGEAYAGNIPYEVICVNDSRHIFGDGYFNVWRTDK